MHSAFCLLAAAAAAAAWKPGGIGMVNFSNWFDPPNPLVRLVMKAFCSLLSQLEAACEKLTWNWQNNWDAHDGK